MEQKQLDELEETYFGEEFIEDEDISKIPGEPVEGVKKNPSASASLNTEEKKPKKLIKNVPKKPRSQELEESDFEDQNDDPVTAIIEDDIKINPASEKSSRPETNYNSDSSLWKIIAVIIAVVLVFALIAYGPKLYHNMTDSNNPTGAAVTMIDGSKNPVLGNENAPVTITAYLNYNDPVSKKDWHNLKLIEANYLNAHKVKIIYKDLISDQTSEQAALAARCAHEQSKFFDYQAALFQQESLNADTYNKLASEVGLNLDKFQSCLSEKKYAPAINADLSEAKGINIEIAPVLIINGNTLSGEVSFADLRTAVNDALASVAASETTFDKNTASADTNLTQNAIKPQPVRIPSTIGEVKEFTIVAKRYVFTPDGLRVKVGDKVKLVIIPDNFEFVFSLVGYQIDKKITEPTTIEFTADKVGSYPFKCSSCEDFRGMLGYLVVDPN